MASDIEEIAQGNLSRMKRKSGKLTKIESLESINGVNVPTKALRPVIDLLNYSKDLEAYERTEFLKDIEYRVETETMHQDQEDETSHYRRHKFVKEKFGEIRGSLTKKHTNYATRINKAFGIIGSHNGPKLKHLGMPTKFTVEMPGRSTIEREKNLENVPIHIRWVEEARCVPGLIPATWMTLPELENHQEAIIECFNAVIPEAWRLHRANAKARRDGHLGSPLGKNT